MTVGAYQSCTFVFLQAVVNEDASGDMNGLRQEIQELKVGRKETLQCEHLMKMPCYANCFQ